MDDPEALNLPEVSEVKPKRKKKLTFQRPPFANEFFTEENKSLFDAHPAYSRHFIKQYLLTQNLKLSARQANMNRGLAKVEGDIEEAKTKDVADLLETHGLGPGELVTYLHDCVKAEGFTKDKHGNVRQTIDLKVRLQAIELILRLTGQMEKKKPVGAQAAVDLFKGIELEDTPINEK